MSKEVEQKVKQIKLSEIDRLKLENIELKMRSLQQQYDALEKEKSRVIEVMSKSNGCKIEEISSIDLDNGVILIKN